MGYCFNGILSYWDFVGILSGGKNTLWDFVLAGFCLGGILSGEIVLWDFVWVGFCRVGNVGAPTRDMVRLL